MWSEIKRELFTIVPTPSWQWDLVVVSLAFAALAFAMRMAVG